MAIREAYKLIFKNVENADGAVILPSRPHFFYDRQQ
jgi:hypothetical protein